MSDNKGFLCNWPKVTGSSKIHKCYPIPIKLEGDPLTLRMVF